MLTSHMYVQRSGSLVVTRMLPLLQALVLAVPEDHCWSCQADKAEGVHTIHGLNAQLLH